MENNQLNSKKIKLELRNISKHFKGIYANKNINISLYEGEILSILGENGSGKTTLMNVLSGIYTPDEGEIYINNKLANIHSPKDAFEYGIGMVHQHFKLVDTFTAIENIILGLKDKLSFGKYIWKMKVKNDTLFHKITIIDNKEKIKEEYFEYYYDYKEFLDSRFKFISVTTDFTDKLDLTNGERILVVLQK